MSKQEVIFDTVICTFDMEFDNSAYEDYVKDREKLKESSLPIKAGKIFEMFPFCILFQVCSALKENKDALQT